MSDYPDEGQPININGSGVRPIPAFGAVAVPASVEVLGIDVTVGTLTALRARPQAGGLKPSGSKTGEGSGSKGVALLVPGFTGSKEDFYELLPLLADRGWDAWAVSQRGQADSAAPAGVASYGREQTAGDIVEVAQAIARVCDVERVHLLGHSFGGTVAQAAAIQDAAVFASLTLLCSGPHGWPGRHETDRRMILEHPGVDLWRLNNPAQAAVPDADLGDQLFYRQRAERTSADQLLGAIAQLADVHDHTFELRDVGIQAMICHGVDDPAWPQDWQRRMARMLGARYEVIARAAHCPNIENPDATAAILDDFWMSVTAEEKRKR